jgi:hypothetical protein
MNEPSKALVDLVKNLKIIHLAIFGGLAFFALGCYYLRDKIGSALTTEQLEILTCIALVFMFIEIPLGYYLHTRKVKSLAENPDIKYKLDSYKSSYIIKLALFEGVGILASIILLLGGKNIIMIQIVIVLIFILLNNPSGTRLSEELNISPDGGNV